MKAVEVRARESFAKQESINDLKSLLDLCQKVVMASQQRIETATEEVLTEAEKKALAKELLEPPKPKTPEIVQAPPQEEVKKDTSGDE